MYDSEFSHFGNMPLSILFIILLLIFLLDESHNDNSGHRCFLFLVSIRITSPMIFKWKFFEYTLNTYNDTNY